MKPRCRDTLHSSLWSKLPFDFSVCPRKSLGPASRANVCGDVVQAQDAAPEGWARQLSPVLLRRLQGSWGRASRGWTHRALPGRAPSVRADAASVLLYARPSPGPSWQLGPLPCLPSSLDSATPVRRPRDTADALLSCRRDSKAGARAGDKEVHGRAESGPR